MLRLLTITVLMVAINTHGAVSVVNNDGASEGLNDPTSVSPVGGNTGTTLGQQRLNVFNKAAEILNSVFNITQPVQVNAQFNGLFCDASSATLGQAGPANYQFINSGGEYTVYPDALYNQISGSDVAAGTLEINATFNSNLDTGACLGGKVWYYGYDDNAGSNTSFLPVALHEIMHGMGFLSLLGQDGASGATVGGQQVFDIYTKHLKRESNNTFLKDMNQTDRAAAIISNGDLVWDGSLVNAQTGSLTAGVNNGFVQMYAPSSYAGGSSVGHFDTSVAPNEIMEPSYTEFLDDPGLATQLLADIGWTLSAKKISLTSGDRQLADGGTLQAGLDSVELQLSGGDGEFTVEVIFNGSAQPGLLQSSNSGYQLLMPTSGAFAGTYTLNVTDGNGFTSSFDIERPLRVSTSAPTLLSLAQQQLWIEGAPAATMIDLASSSSEVTFSDDQNQAISQLQAPDDAAQFNRASANLVFSQQPLPNTVTLTANAGVLIPQGEVTADIIRGRQLAMTVDDQNQQPVANASISVTDNRFSDWNLPTLTNSDNSGMANLVLPAEALSLSVSASGYVSQTVQLDATQTELSIILSSQQTPFTISGSVTAQGFDFASERPRVVLILDNENEVVLTTTLNSSRNQASFEWQGDIAEALPESIRITHTQASDITIPVTVSSDSAVINALLLAIPSATEDEPVTLSVGSSAAGGSALWLLLLAIGLTFFTRKAFTH